MFKRFDPRLFALLLALLLALAGCAGVSAPETAAEDDAPDPERFLRITNEEPDTADPQCTDYYYDIPLNIFDRLVEVRVNDDGTTGFAPSLAKSWEISDDGLVYTFHLQRGVTFSNGSPFTAADVEYTLIRAITHPDSLVGDVDEFIVGADELLAGKSEWLEGFRILDDYNFTITLTEPYAAFLAILSIPGYSILDAETTIAAGNRFGKDPAVTVGTGPFIFTEWNAGSDIRLVANKNCWSGAPGCEGILVQFVVDAEAKRLMFEAGQLDILDLENLGTDAEYFIRGDIYKNQLSYGRRVGMTFVALNQSIKPLDDVRVRRALQISLDRRAILMSVYGGRGSIENGIYPHGLIGFNPDLAQIPYDPQAAIDLLSEAGYPDGFDLELCVETGTVFYSREILELAASMWKKIGVHTTVKTLDKEEFALARTSGQVACYSRRFSVDYNDPEAIIYPFFGTLENVRYRGLYYEDLDILERVYYACNIVSEEDRLAEYRDLERIIVQEDCAWIPLFSNDHYFAVSGRVRNFRVSWNGWTDTQYRDITLDEE
ncbi:MAG: ABC transporter substrate-binding protein [Clostridia bacterium]|nr:ABC transporter substrate-binding protein [Clostridia bacterium]